MRDEADYPKQIPLLVGYLFFEKRMRYPCHRKGEQHLREERMAVAAMYLQLQNLIMRQEIEEDVEVGNGFGYGANDGCFVAYLFAEGYFANGTPQNKMRERVHGLYFLGGYQ